MPSYEIRYLNGDGELALIHKTRHEDDEAVGQAARMLVGSGFAEYEIWRDDESQSTSKEREPESKRRILKSTLRPI